MASVIYVPVIPVRPGRCSDECVQYITDSSELTVHMVSQMFTYGFLVVLLIWGVVFAIRGASTAAELLAYFRDWLKDRKDNRS